MAQPRSKWEQQLQDSEDDAAERVYSLWLDAQDAVKGEGYWHSLHDKHAAHEVWCSLPKPLRVPKTQKELAEWLEVDQDTLINWRKKHRRRYAASDEKVKRLVLTMVGDVLGAAYLNAVEGGKDGAGDRKLILAAAGVTTVNADVTSGGAPLKAYSVLAHPDLWDDDNDNPTVDPAPLANPAVAG